MESPPTTEPCVIENSQVISGCSIDGPIPMPDDGYAPFVRGEQIYLGVTPAGECVGGSTQWTYEPCGEGLTWYYDAKTDTIIDPANVRLPVTGDHTAQQVSLAGTLVLVGAIVVYLTRRKRDNAPSHIEG